MPLPDTSEERDAHASKGGCPVLGGFVNKGMYAVPSLFSPDDFRPIVLFDGSCNLCNAAVRRLLDYDSCRNDPRGNLRVAALQSRVGELLCQRMPERVREDVLAPVASGERTTSSEEEEVEKYRSIVVCTPDRTYTKSSAVLLIGRSLGGKLKPLRYLSLLAYAIPASLRDRVYKWVSRRRRKWFGTASECRLWDDNFDQRFVDDGVLTGKFRDPFGDPNAPPPPAPAVDEGVELPSRGDRVRIVWPQGADPRVIYFEDGHPDGLCLVGGTGTVGTVDPPRRVVVKVDRDSLGLASEASGGVIHAAVKPWELGRLEEQ